MSSDNPESESGEAAESLPQDAADEPATAASPETALGASPPGAGGGRALWVRGPRWGRRLVAVVAAAAVLVLVGFAGHEIGSPTSQAASQPIPQPSSASPGVTSSGSLNVSQVTSKVEPGVVDITAVDGYQDDSAAGTGMVLTSNGEVLTNNHVIAGATKITAQVDGVGTRYTAKVVGYDVTDDIALLQLQGASGLATVQVGDSNSVKVGEGVVAIGNALDLPGRPTVTSGTITALGRSVSASDEGASSSERLSNMIQSDASLCSGNSGGPLANAAGQVIGMNTAAETDSNDSCSTVGFAIPIDRALSIASQIQEGQSSSNVHIGLPAFLGVDVESVGSLNQGGGFGGGFGGGYNPPVSAGALVTQVLPQTAAQSAGLAAGDVITKAGGQSISTEEALSKVISSYKPGQSMSLTWVDSQDNSHSATVTLGTGPAA